MTKALAGLVLAAALMVGDCFNQTTSQFNQPGGGGSPTGGSSLCEGLITSINVDSESGSAVAVGSIITFSADPRDSAGNSVPADCKRGAVSVEALGVACGLASNLPSSLDSIELFCGGPGECKARVSFAGVVGTSEPVVCE